MLPLVLRRCLFFSLILMPVLAPAQSTPAKASSAQATAAMLGTRLDTLQRRLDQIRDAHGEPLRQAAMEQHWKAMQDYMQESLKSTQPEPTNAAAPASDCRVAGGAWRGLSFPGQIRSDDYLGVMQAHLGRMRQDVLVIHAATHPQALDDVLRRHWRSNYEFLQRTRGLDWMFDGWMPSGPGDRDLPSPDSEGAHLTQALCSTCHAVPHARLHTASEWDDVMSTMTRHIASSDTGLPACVRLPTPAQLETIRAYLGANGR